MPNSAPTNRAATAAVVVALVVLLGVAAALFGLGPFADDGTTDNRFLAQGDRICADSHHAFADQQQAQPKTPSEAAAMTVNLRELAETELRQIQSLTPPPALRKPLQRYLAAREEAIRLMQKGITAAKDDDFASYRAYQAEVAAGQLQRQRLAREVGFAECSKPSVDEQALREQAQPPGSTSLDRPNEVNNPPPGTP